MVGSDRKEGGARLAGVLVRTLPALLLGAAAAAVLQDGGVRKAFTSGAEKSGKVCRALRRRARRLGDRLRRLVQRLPKEVSRDEPVVAQANQATNNRRSSVSNSSTSIWWLKHADLAILSAQIGESSRCLA